MTSHPDGVFINASGTIEAVVYGFGGIVPTGLSFQAVSDASNYKVGTLAVSVFAASVKAALAASDTTMHRIAEGVSSGLTTWTAADVVTWVTYRRSLRALLSASSTVSLPERPPYPAGTL